MKQQAGSVLDEVHQIAMNYHWSSDEILGLSILRRRSYLLRIEAAVDRRILGDLGVGGS